MRITACSMIGLAFLAAGGCADTGGAKGEVKMALQEVIIDNSDAGFEVIDGKWNISTRDAGFEGYDYLWCRGTEPWPSQGKRTSGLELVRWRFEPPRGGRYKVCAKWVASKPEDRATDAPYTILHRDGMTVVRVNMADLSLSGKWNLLGTFDFEKGHKAEVILNTNADNTVVADAVRFEYEGPSSAAPRRTFPEKDVYAKYAEKGKVVFAEDFEGGLENWILEGPAEVAVRDGRLWVKTLPMPGHMAWIRKKAPAAFRLEFDVTPLSESGFWLVFFCANTFDSDMFDAGQPGREGVFDRYTHNKALRCYHTSYRRNLAGNCNVRKNPGLRLVASTPDLGTLPANETHHVALTYREGRIVLAVDGRQFADYTDKETPYGAGYIALRNVYDSETVYDNVVIYDVSAD